MVLSDKIKFQIFSLRSTFSFDLPCTFHSLTCNNSKITCDCLKVEQTDKMKYLGLIIDSKLTWKPHVTKIKQELYKCVRTFYFLKNMCPEKVLLNLYHALVNSRLSYGLCCWGGTYFSTLQPLIILQKHLIRIIAKQSKLKHSWPFFTYYKILPLRHLFVYKVLRSFYNRSSNVYNTFDKQYNLRHNLTCPVPRSKFKFHQQFYLNSAPRLYNMISHKISSRLNFNLFSINLKKYLLKTECINDLFNFVV